MPGRATSLATVGVLVGLAGLAVLLSVSTGTPFVRPTGRAPQSAAGLQPGSGAPSANAPGKSASGPNSHDSKEMVGTAITERFTCPMVAGPEPQLSFALKGLPDLVATTFCRDSSWYVSERIASLVAKPFRIPYDPPIPASVAVDRFVPVVPGGVPAVLVRLEDYGTAGLYELFTAGGDGVQPAQLSPGASPIMLLRSTGLLQGAGFSCTWSPTGEIIRQYQWYVINPTTLKTSHSGKILGDPGVFLQTTVYAGVSRGSFSSTSLTIVQEGYDQVASYTGESC